MSWTPMISYLGATLVFGIAWRLAGCRACRIDAACAARNSEPLTSRRAAKP